MAAGPSSADVPGAYDLVIAVNGGATSGYLYNDALESSLPFRTHRATYTYTPTFIERTNVQGDYGDNQQDFFLTATQRDWSLGEAQRYFRAQDGNSARRYWIGSALNTSTPGEIAMRPDRLAITFSATPVSLAADPIGLSGPSSQLLAATSTKLFAFNGASLTDENVHGLGATPALWGLCSDGAKAYLSCNKTDNAASVGVRTWNGTAYSTFSATGVDSLAFLNNTLYGLDWHDGNLYRFDTAGTATSIFQWKDAAGNGMRVGGSTAVANSKIFPFGGKLGILLVPNNNSAATAASLWVYDGTGVSMVAVFPGGFSPYDACVSKGQVFISGGMYGETAGRPTIMYWASGNLGTLWQAAPPATWSSTKIPMCGWAGGLLFGEPGLSALHYYDANEGGITTVSTSWAPGSALLASMSTSAFGVQTASTNAFAFTSGASTVSAATVSSSLFDFDSSLTKLFRGITVDYEGGTDGNGGSVDVAYQTDSVVGSYTSLATGVTSGTENLLSNISGRSISVKLTLNKGTSTYGPVVRKLLVRGAPVLTRYKQREYVLDCSGDPATNNKRILRNGDIHPLSGRSQVDALVVASELLNSTPSAFLTITDRLGSYTGIIDSLEVYEEHPSSKPNAGKSGSFTVKIVARQI